MTTKNIKLFLLRGGFLIAVALANPISMIPMASIPTEVQAAETPTVEPRADEIVWYYRTLSDGTIQKRRWNRSRNCWVDPDWIDVN